MIDSWHRMTSVERNRICELYLQKKAEGLRYHQIRKEIRKEMYIGHKGIDMVLRRRGLTKRYRKKKAEKPRYDL